MQISMPFDMSPRCIAKPLDTIQAWRVADDDDLSAMHRGVLRTLGAMDSLSRVEVPMDLRAPGSVKEPDSQSCELVRGLIQQAERALDSVAHRVRIERVRNQSPAHATQLERTRQEALDQVRRLRLRLDFIRGLDDALIGSPAPAVKEQVRPAGAMLQ